MSMTKGTRPIDASNLARRIREYMDDFPNATTRLATCRAILSMLGDENQTPTLHPITREQVEKMRGEWIDCDGGKVPVDKYGQTFGWAMCSACGEYLTASDEYPCIGHFCPNCGAPMTDKAVDMVMERLEALGYGKDD